MRQFIVTIPDEMIEAARIDGAREFTIWRHIILPQTTRLGSRSHGPAVAVGCMVTVR
jgi:ABC-type amino acid transport system permease subunit